VTSVQKTHVFHRAPKIAIPKAVAGDGVYIIDSDGKRYLDGSGGAAVSCLGHSDPDVIQAIKDQVDKLIGRVLPRSTVL
jgi:adenosylmethionine-8-amino-7-oxononanoate aminotransferase